jgi:TolB-like protein/AraC-like DNA-binding protein/Tfp pilus assembly protein PilF
MNATYQRRQSDELIQKLNQIVLDNLDNEQFGVNELAVRVGMNRSHLYRKVLVRTKKSLSEFIREIRLTEALKILKEETVTVSEVAYRVGFNNPSYFNTCFHDHFGFPPGEAKQVNLENTIRLKKREKNPGKHRFSSATRYAFIAILVLLLIVSMATVFFLERDKDVIEDKSIAVLPFKYMGDDPEKQYLADGMMDAILNHLSKIKDLRVIDRTSVEQYRGTDKTSNIICKELDAKFLLEGSFQKYGDQARLGVRLIRPGKRSHIWAKEYDRNWKDILLVQSEVAQTIAKELQAVITPTEKQLMEKVPTTSLTAYDFYQRGREEQFKYWLDDNNKEAIERAENLFNKALEYDSIFAPAYTGLAWVYWNKYYYKTYLTEEFLDSALTLADIALSFDPQLSEAYVIRGNYYRRHNQNERAINEFDKAIKFNPNDWQAYYRKGWLYFSDDYVEHIDNLQKAASLHRGTLLPQIYRDIGLGYAHTGFKEKAISYVKEALKLDDDSAQYYCFMGEIEDINGNFGKAIEFLEESYAIDSSDLWVMRLIAQGYLYLDQFEESLECYKIYEERLKALDRPLAGSMIFQIGYAYWANGFKKEAEYYFETGMEFQNELVRLGRYHFTFYAFAGIYAFMGDSDKAYEYLRLINQNPRMPLYFIKNYKYNPLFDNIRDEPEFQRFLHDVEAKYQAEHKRVRKWLEENDLL